MKKGFRFISVLMIMLMLLSAFPVELHEAEAATVKLNKSNVTLETGAKFRLVLRNADGKVKWSSGNKEIVTVNTRGVVTAIAPGKAKITAKYNGKKYKCTFNVPNPELNYTHVDLKVGETVKLKLSGAEVESFSTKYASIAKISSKGVVTALKGGQTTIVVTDINGRTYGCIVDVHSDEYEHKHVIVDSDPVAATCTTEGKTKGSYCAICKEVMEEQTVIPALGHSYNEEGYCIRCGQADPNKHHTHEFITESTPATCLTKGLSEKVYCKTCGEVFMQAKEIPALGHDWVNGHCSRCGCEWYCDHKFKTVKEIPATCTTDGLSEYTVCELCGFFQSEPKTIPALGHNYAGTDRCLRCGADVNGHIHTWHIEKAKAPTCTEPGNTEYKYCTVCNYVESPFQFILPTGHVYDENGVCRLCKQKKQ